MSGRASGPAAASARGIDTRRQSIQSLALLGGQASGRALGLAVQAFIARALSAEQFGLYALGWTFVLLGQTFGHLGLTDGALRFLPRHRAESPARVKGFVLETLGFGLAFSALLAGGAVVFAAPLGALFGEPAFAPVLVAFAPALMLAPVLHVAAAMTRAAMMVRHSALIVDIGLPLMILIFCVLAWSLGYRVVGMAAGTSLAFLIALVLCLGRVAQIYRAEIRQRAPAVFQPAETLRFSLGALSLSGISILMTVTDRMFIARYDTATAVGLYHAAAQMVMPVAIIYGSLTGVVAPIAAAASWQNRPEELEQAYRNMCRWGLYLGFPALLILIAFSGGVLRTIYGAEFVTGRGAMRVLLTGQLVLLFAGLSGVVLVMSGHVRWWLGCSAVALVGNAAGNLVLIPRYGIMGAAVATAGTGALLQIVGVLTVRARFGFWPLARHPALAAIAGGGAALLTYAVASIQLGWPDLGSRILAAGAGLGAFFALLGAWKVYEPDLRLLLGTADGGR